MNRLLVLIGIMIYLAGLAVRGIRIGQGECVAYLVIIAVVIMWPKKRGRYDPR